MSVFGDILKAIGIKTGDQNRSGSGTDKAQGGVAKKPASHVTLGTPGKPVDRPDMAMVDVEKKLDDIATSKLPQKLEWRLSIVDLLTLLGIDSSYKNRVELAKELGAPADQMDDSARMNIWLHKTVLKKISENGGYVPANLMD